MAYEQSSTVNRFESRPRDWTAFAFVLPLELGREQLCATLVAWYQLCIATHAITIYYVVALGQSCLFTFHGYLCDESVGDRAPSLLEMQEKLKKQLLKKSISVSSTSKKLELWVKVLQSFIKGMSVPIEDSSKIQQEICGLLWRMLIVVSYLDFIHF